MTIDPRRLARALHLDCQALSWDRWLVTGGQAPHVVDGGRCDCWDSKGASEGGRTCKHVLRVYLDALAPEILAALKSLVELPAGTRTVVEGGNIPSKTYSIAPGDRFAVSRTIPQVSGKKGLVT